MAFSVRVQYDKLSLGDLSEIDKLKKFISWYKTSQPNGKYCYHVGSHLDVDRATWKLKLLTWKYATNGWVYLVQSKIHVDKYEYIAIKSSAVHKKLNPSELKPEKVAKWLLNPKQ